MASEKLDNFGKVVTILAQVVAIVVGIAAFSSYRDSVHAHLADRTSEWVSKMEQSGDVWSDAVQTLKYLKKSDVSKEEKIKTINENEVLRDQIHTVLAFMEDLGYLYNEHYIDRDFIRRGAAGAIMTYYDNSKFYIDYRRNERPNMYKEFEAMAIDLKKTTAQ